jgi:hypothetical protein
MIKDIWLVDVPPEQIDDKYSYVCLVSTGLLLVEMLSKQFILVTAVAFPFSFVLR